MAGEKRGLAKPRVVLSVILLIVCLNLSILAQGQEELKALYDRGLEYGLGGDFVSAQDVLQQAAVAAPENVPIMTLLLMTMDVNSGMVSIETGVKLLLSVDSGNRGNWDEALSSAEEAVRSASDYSLGQMHLGTVYASLAAQGRDEEANALKAIEAYKKAIELNPHSGLTHFNLAVAYGALRRWDEAYEHLERAESLGMSIPTELKEKIEREAGRPLKEDSGNASEDGSGEGTGNFNDGFFGPLVFIVNAPQLIFRSSAEGSATVNQLWQSTWGRGSGSYRMGFVAGVLAIMLLLGGGGAGARMAVTKTNGRKKGKKAEKDLKGEALRKVQDNRQLAFYNGYVMLDGGVLAEDIHLIKEGKEPLFRAGEPVPCEAIVQAAPSREDQESVEVAIYQESIDAYGRDADVFIFEVLDIPPGRPGVRSIEVSIKVNADGKLIVEATDRESHQSLYVQRKTKMEFE